MDFSFSEEQDAVRDLAAQVFAGDAPVERVKEIERSDDRIDRELWRALADAGLLAIAVPEEYGGSGLGLVELALLLEQQGRHVAPVPLWPTLVLGAPALAEFGTTAQREAWLPGIAAGDVFLTAALAEPGANDPLHTSVTAAPADGRGDNGGTWRLDGAKPSVPAAHVADRVLVPAVVPDGTTALFLVDPAASGVERTVGETTDRSLVAHLAFTGAPAARLGEGPETARALSWTVERAFVGLAALQVGVAEAAVRMAADYTSQRHQFGKPLSTFQGVALKAADAYIDTEAMRVTLWQAAWRLTAGLDATREVMVAKWWASEGGQRAVHITQHLHGGMGADVDYPVHRYFLWGKQIEDTLGGASAQLARLGATLKEYVPA